MDLSKIVNASLTCRALGATVKDDAASKEVCERKNARSGAMRVQKVRLKAATEPVRTLFRKAREVFNYNTLPGFTDDLRILPTARVDALRERIEGYRQSLNIEVANIVDNYDRLIDEEKNLLGDGYDPNLYPAKEAIAGYFRIDLGIFEVSRGEFSHIEQLSLDTIAQLREEQERRLAEIGRQARNEVHAEMVRLIQHIADKLSDPEAKAFHESTFENLREYLALVPALNITNDFQLESMRSAAASKLDLCMEHVKRSQYLKDRAAREAREILNQFGNLGEGRAILVA